MSALRMLYPFYRGARILLAQVVAGNAVAAAGPTIIDLDGVNRVCLFPAVGSWLLRKRNRDAA